jgi:hypothetical protein
LVFMEVFLSCCYNGSRPPGAASAASGAGVMSQRCFG